MKTTLVLDDAVVRQLKAYARRRRISASRAAQDLIRTGLIQERATPEELPPLPAAMGASFWRPSTPARDCTR